MKRIILIASVIILIGLVFRVINYTSSHSYDFVEIDKLRLDRIIKHNYLDSIDITTAVGSNNDTLFQIKYRHYCILVWNIANYHSITQDNISFDINNRNRNFYFTPYSSREISPVLTMKYKLSNHQSKGISINLSRDSEVYDSIEYMQEKGYCIRTANFGIGNDKKRSNIIFDFKEMREVIIIFYNKNVLIFYSYDNQKLDKKTFTDILN